MRVRASIRKRCAACQMVKRRRHFYVVCRVKPSHKQKQG